MEAFGPRHDPAKPLLDLSLDSFECLRPGLDPVHGLPVVVQQLAKRTVPLEPGIEELDSSQEVSVVIILVTLVVQRIHPVGCRRKEKEANV